MRGEEKTIITFWCPIYLKKWLDILGKKTGNRSQVIVNILVKERDKEPTQLYEQLKEQEKVMQDIQEKIRKTYGEKDIEKIGQENEERRKEMADMDRKIIGEEIEFIKTALSEKSIGEGNLIVTSKDRWNILNEKLDGKMSHREYLEMIEKVKEEMK